MQPLTHEFVKFCLFLIPLGNFNNFLFWESNIRFVILVWNLIAYCTTPSTRLPYDDDVFHAGITKHLMSQSVPIVP